MHTACINLFFNGLLFSVCSCIQGASGPACWPDSAVEELREDFSELPLSSTLWRSFKGNNGNLLARCERLTGKPAQYNWCVHKVLVIFRTLLNVI